MSSRAEGGARSRGILSRCKWRVVRSLGYAPRGAPLGMMPGGDWSILLRALCLFMVNLHMIKIRKFEEEDWEIFKKIRLKALQSDPGVFGSNYQQEAGMPDDYWHDLIKDQNARFGVFNDGEIIGMTGIAIYRDDPTGKTAILWGSWLKPDFRGKGISDQMYKARIAWAENHPVCERIIVSHRASNLASKHANQKHGFIFTHRKIREWPDGTTEDELFYELKVKP